MIEKFLFAENEQKRVNKFSALLVGSFKKDEWDINDPFFGEFLEKDPELSRRKQCKFLVVQNVYIRQELKAYYAYALTNKLLKIDSVFTYGTSLVQFSGFIEQYYPGLKSINSIDLEKATFQYSTYLIEKDYRIKAGSGKQRNAYLTVLFQLYNFIFKFYDDRDEFEKDIWDCRNIPGAKIAANHSDHLLNFEEIPKPFKPMVKRYLKIRLSRFVQGTCSHDLRAVRRFMLFIHKIHPNWSDLQQLSRADIEQFVSHLVGQSLSNRTKNSQLNAVRAMLEYIQRAEYTEAPIKPAYTLIFPEDMPRIYNKKEDDIKYIPEDVLLQLEANLQNLQPTNYIPMVMLLRATGWRISDISNLRYDKCLEKINDGWYLCGDIVKTGNLNHRVPITEEVAAVVATVIQETKSKSDETNNPEKYLFVRFSGTRMGRPPSSRDVSAALNVLAKKHNIVDNEGNLFRFGNHAFRHTKAVEMINNGMNIIHLQKWLAHSSPEMTLAYARILDTTLRESWEKVTKKGLFRINESGTAAEINPSDVEREDIIEWEYIRHNLDAVRMDLGYCTKPLKQPCPTQINPCLTCRSFCTTPDFASEFEKQINDTKQIIEKGKTLNRPHWVDKNEEKLKRLEPIYESIKKGSVHQLGGKKNREYTREERKSGN
ncbi:tyrosine-type recombinase/integrase [Peribacillus kribbensis]|uniref:tyrosine-type recombinase/integrase n=1 Tax=Peribacillus kribbensis TaxID=356658 RepID=UPI0003F659D0|nr:tyrosine-type recombinase/integrase [Peribacillus kribbensis]